MAVPSITFGDAIFFAKKNEELFSYDCYSLAEKYLTPFSDRIFQCTEIRHGVFEVKNITSQWRVERDPWLLGATLASYLLRSVTGRSDWSASSKSLIAGLGPAQALAPMRLSTPYVSPINTIPP